MGIDALHFTLFILVLIVLFLIFRGINLWYFRINTIVANQEKNNQLLSEIVKHLKPVKDSFSETPIFMEGIKVLFLNNQKVALSGEFVGTSRGKVEEHLKEQGAIIQRSIDVDSDFLITGRNPHHGDTQAAKANNIEILSFDDYLKLNKG